MPVIAVPLDRDAIAQACRRFGVVRLRLFGSAVTGRFDEDHSDLGFLVDFADGRENRFEDFFGLRDALEQASRRRVDLLTTESLRNPYLRASVLPTAVDVYAA